MTIASHGYDGTLDETDFSRLMKLVGRAPIVAGPTDLAVAGVPGSRTVTVAVGTAYGLGVQVDVAPAERLNVPAPNQGQFFLIVLRRDWSANNSDPDAGPLLEGSSMQILPSDTTTTAVPAAPPTVLPLLKNDPGLIADQPLAWVWASSTTTDVVVFDLRAWEADAERVAHTAGRDAIPAERLWVGKRVLVASTGKTYRRAATTWNLEGLNPCTSTTHPAEPFLNMMIFETDLKRFGYWDGAVWVFPGSSAAAFTEGTLDTARLPDAVQRAAAEVGVDEERLGRAAKNISDQDLNGIRTTGFYRGQNVYAAPSADWFYFLVIRNDAQYVKQVAFWLHGSSAWIRTLDGGTWSAWKFMPTTDDLDAGLMDSRYYTEAEINSFRSGDLTDAGRITYNGGGISSFLAWLEASYSSKGDVENRINSRGLSRIATGWVDNVLNNTPVSVTFPQGRFTGQPSVVATPNSLTNTTPNSAIVGNVSAGGFTLMYLRGTNAAATINWIAAQGA